ERVRGEVVEVRADGYESERNGPLATADTIAVTLFPASSITMTVEDTHGNPLPDIAVELRPIARDALEGGTPRRGTSNASGFVRFDRLVAGRYRLSIAFDGAVPWVLSSIDGRLGPFGDV